MPRGDRTGPEGMGPMTGRALGYCRGSKSPGYTKNIPNYGRMGMGRGFRHGYGYWRDNDPEPYMSDPEETLPKQADSMKILQDEMQKLNKSLENISRRLEKLETK